MKIVSFIATLPCLGSLLLTLNAPAQGLKFDLTFSGTCISNSANGSFVSVPITSQNWLSDFARSHGISNLQAIRLIYHLGGNALGDTIEIVDASTGAVLEQPFGLYFGEDSSLGRSGLSNRIGSQIARLEYVYTSQNSRAMGSALLTEHAFLSADGTVTNATIQGRMQYTFLADGTHNLQMCSGVLSTGKLVTFPNQ